ncbi:MAG: VacJ family lipoprotein [Proteobacteria bacterium]|nr:VacJ family lipoprotein [Pseudomonadota bacterium]
MTQSRKTTFFILTLLTLALFTATSATASSKLMELDNVEPVQYAKSSVDDSFDSSDEDFDDDEFGDEEELAPMPDPFESINRLTFAFNDKLYFWALKPAAKGYMAVVPESGRVAVKHFFNNLAAPIRIVNTALQLKFKESVTEIARFSVNTTFGLAGFRDTATDTWEMPLYREDFGQTLGHYGSGPGFFINLPFYGPSSLRDGVGLIGDTAVDPRTYLPPDKPLEKLGVTAYKAVNSTSLNIDFYDDIKADALDPYTYIRDAFHQYREHLVTE